MKKILLPILLILALLVPTGCFGSAPTAAQVRLGQELIIAQKEMSDVVKIGLELKDKYERGEIDKIEFVKETAKNAKEYEEAFSAFSNVKTAIEDINDSGGSWVDTAKYLGLIFHRTLIHGARMAILAFFPGAGGSAVAGLLGMALGGSQSGRDKKKSLL